MKYRNMIIAGLIIIVLVLLRMGCILNEKIQNPTIIKTTNDNLSITETDIPE